MDRCRNNIVLSGVPGVEKENVLQVVEAAIPTRIHIVEARRLGPEPVSSSPKYHRRILVKLTAPGKQLVWAKRRQLMINDNPVYVNHDLTRQEQEARRQILPKYKLLRKREVACSIPRGVILLSGKPMTMEKIDTHLSKQTACCDTKECTGNRCCSQCQTGELPETSNFHAFPHSAQSVLLM